MNPRQKNKNSVLKVILWPFKSYIRIMIVVAVIGFFQYQSIQIDILAREVRTLELKKKQLINERALLQVEIDRLTHINRIEKLARETFGLISSGEDIHRMTVKKFEHEVNPDQYKPKLAGVH